MRTGHAPENMAVIRHMAMNLLRQAKPTTSLKNRRKRSGWNTSYLKGLIRVTPASVQDRDTSAVPASELAQSSLVMAWADLACKGEAATAPMTRCAIEPELIGRQNKTSFKVEPK